MVKAKPVRVYDWRGNFIREFNSRAEVSVFIGCSQEEVSAVCLRKDAFVYGYITRYAQDDDWFILTQEERVRNYLSSIGVNFKAVTKLLNNNIVATYRTFAEAAASVGVKPSYIGKVLNSKVRNVTVKGYVFRLATVDEVIQYGIFNNADKHTIKPIRQYNLDGKFVAEYSSITEAARAMGVSLSSISCALNGKTYSSAGYIWREAVGSKSDIRVRPAHVNDNSVAVRLYDKSGAFFREFDSIAQCALFLGISCQSVCAACQKKSSIKGWQIRYAKEGLDKIPVLMRRIVLQYTMDGKFIRSYNSCAEAARALGKALGAANIGGACLGRYKQAYGYIWRYKDIV